MECFLGEKSLVVTLFKIVYALKMVSFPKFITEFDEIACIRTSIPSSIGGINKKNWFFIVTVHKHWKCQHTYFLQSHIMTTNFVPEGSERRDFQRAKKAFFVCFLIFFGFWLKKKFPTGWAKKSAPFSSDICLCRWKMSRNRTLCCTKTKIEKCRGRLRVVCKKPFVKRLFGSRVILILLKVYLMAIIRTLVRINSSIVIQLYLI